MVTQKIKTNAAIAYFFLGWIFLLARNNPDFHHPFIKQHAKIATKGHCFFLIGYFLYARFLSSFFMSTIPLLNITIDRLIDLSVFTVLTGFILYGAYHAGKGEMISDAEQDILSDTAATVFEYSNASEADRVMLFLSYIPFLGISIARKYKNPITVIGANTGTLFILCYGASLIWLGFDSFSMIFLFLYILLVAFLGVRFFFSNHCRLPGIFKKIPSLDLLWQMARVVPLYIKSIFLVSTGKKDALDYRQMLAELQASDVQFQELMNTHFNDATIPFPSYLIFLPGVNIIFIPKLFLSRNTRYVIAIGQGLILTILMAVFIVFSFSSRFNLLLVFPALLWMTNISYDAFYRIPIIYELYSLLNTLTFWFLENTKKLRATKAKKQSVSFKVQ